MVSFSIISPLDQPTGNRRLLSDLKVFLADAEFVDFKFIVAYAKSGPFLRLKDHFVAWRKAAKSSSVIIGLDQQGTSKEALELALSLFDKVYVTREYGITFHPKIYLFTGPSRAAAFVGSNNFTVGGTEKNFESSVHLELCLPNDAVPLGDLNRVWDELLPGNCPATLPLTQKLLEKLLADGVVVSEAVLNSRGGGSDSARVGRGHPGPRSGLKVKPESPLPQRALVKGPAKQNAPAPQIAVASSPGMVRGIAIQIKPHHNGEIFLSVRAALQNPPFFHWPFLGATAPKKAGNPSYPQLDPDPLVNIVVYGALSSPVLTLNAYALNTVYYAKKSEIRITASPLVGIVPDYSVMVIEESVDPVITWDITIHRPDSSDYGSWLSVCNQTMPSGGAVARRFGWF